MIIKVTDKSVHVGVNCTNNIYNIRLSNLGQRGLQGVKGDKGDTGADGLSAYQIAVNNGFVGTEAEWLASLQPNFNPYDYDLADFNNESADPFARISDIPIIKKLYNKNKEQYTGTTAETIIGTPILIPANTFANLDVLQISGIFQKVGTNGTFDIRIYINTNASLSGASLVWRPSNATSTNISILSHTFKTSPYIIRNGNLHGSWGQNTGTTNYSLNTTGSQPLSRPFDPTVDNYIFATNVLSNSADIFVQELLQIEAL